MRTRIKPGRIAGFLAQMMLLLAPTVSLAEVCANTIQADVVAIDQQIVHNRLGAFNPISMIFALRQDVVNAANGLTEAEGGILTPGNVRLRDDKRPRPLVLRVNEGDCLRISFQNLLAPAPLVLPPDAAGEFAGQPATRHVGMAIMGVSFADMVSSGVNVGNNPVSGYAAPGETKVYLVRGEHEGGYHINSIADNVSGEGIQGQTSFGLFGALNVQKKGAVWYRNQTTNAELLMATTGLTPSGHPIIDYDAVYPVGHRYAGQPILRILDPVTNKIVHNEVNAIITGPNGGDFPAGTYQRNPTYPDRDRAFREFTVMFHDEVETVQPFPIFIDPQFKFTLGGVKDGFMINYGSAAVGTEVVANRSGVGPTWDCAECKFEEFFLSSWAVSDPAMLVDVPANTTDVNGNLIVGPKATKALYPDDPSNVFHAYINDRAKIRNLHFGKEFHVFHLHAQQWLFSPDDDGSNYLDAQGIGPGGSYTYEVAYNSGNRNKIVGDTIFHCHFYPHFAQGMWALYRLHDVFEAGTQLDANGLPIATARALPDGEIAAGTPIPAVVPIPTMPMAPVPGKVRITQVPGYPGGQVVYDEPDKNAGYPFSLGMKAGHRPATPPLDLIDDGGLPRHIVRGTNNPLNPSTLDPAITHHEETPLSFDKVLVAAEAEQLPESGTRWERAAMDFHAREFHATFLPNGSPGQFVTNGLPPVPGAPYNDPCRGDKGGAVGVPRTYKGAVIQFDLKMNKVGHHFPQSRIVTLWGDAQATVDGTRPPEPFFIRANSNDCVNFYHTNLVPSVYEQDDYQVKTPTDVIGQHIHLVKFDVTASDGSANGFNYEDGTMSPDEVRERIHAFNLTGGLIQSDGVTKVALAAKPHPYFGSTFNGRDITGARTTVQRWYVDNIRNNRGEDRTLGNVFTHDHFGPSTHQQTGLYASLLTEPQGSRWRDPQTGQFMGGRFDGGPTSWRADIITTNPAESYREFMVHVADFTLAYEDGACHTVPCVNPAKAIKPPGMEEIGLPFLYRKPQICPNGTLPPCPEAISAEDPGTFLVNYRNEPVAERVRLPGTNVQAPGLAGDLAYALSSRVQRANPLLNQQPAFYPPLTPNVLPGDPFTPLFQVYDNDRVNVRIQAGADEESHTASIHGVKWLQSYGSPNSGFRNSQQLGISEQFQLRMPVIPDRLQVGQTADYLYTLNTSSDGYWSGIWGLMRSYAARQPNLLPLPNNPIGTVPFTAANDALFSGPCPTSAPVRSYDVTAVAARTALPGGSLVYNSRIGPQGIGPLQDPDAVLYVRTGDLNPDGTLKAGVPVEPLVLRAAAGECIDVTLRNKLPAVLTETPGYSAMHPIVEFFNFNEVRTSSVVGLHPQLVEYDVTRSDGTVVGNNQDQTVPPGGVRQYRWYAGDVKVVNNMRVATPIEFGASSLISTDLIKHASRGALGALIIEPLGSSWIEDYPTPHPSVSAGQRPSRASATVIRANGTTFREQVLVIQDDISLRFGDNTPVPFVTGMEDALDTGMKAFNYRTEPLWFRLGFSPLNLPFQNQAINFANVLHNSTTGGDPETPVFTVNAGEETRVRLVQPAGHNRHHTFALYGHVWQREPHTNNSTRLGLNPKSFWRGSQDVVGPASHWDFLLDHGAGGAFRAKGDYLYRDMLPIHFLNGLWGIMRVQ
ncbi:copper oxidase [Geobacter sulfurreducens]|uniref:copper oxidase n=1 Tax=Geobacter sulfurreducens TaxID=35554 RepID=UPI000DBB7F25|nr:copper oxidase [Geobacter sulfurreducens]BBA69776.1 hypothetical protein YM18_1234 [Geobacter sulfurreducens]